MIRYNDCNGTDRTKHLIYLCLKMGIRVVVQTVVTTVNYPYLSEMRKYLEMIGVNKWRLLPVSNLFPNIDSAYQCTSSQLDRLRYTLCHKSNSNLEITMLHDYEKEKDGIILVDPKGTFLLVQDNGLKTCLDCTNPFNPDRNILNQLVNWKAHYLRYNDKSEGAK